MRTESPNPDSAAYVRNRLNRTLAEFRRALELAERYADRVERRVRKAEAKESEQ